MRVQPIAIVAGVGVLALALLLVFGVFTPLERKGERALSRTSERGDEAGEGGGGEGAGGEAGWGEQDPRAGDGEADEPATQTIRGSLVDAEHGPLSEGRVDLWCDDGKLGARVQIDAEGNFSGPACSGRTCARLVHAAFEQPEAWVLEPNTVHELDVTLAPNIEGVVVSTSGEPIPDAKLLLRQGSLRATSRSDLEGAFAVALPRVRPCDPCDGSEKTRGCRQSDAESSEEPATLLAWASAHAPDQIDVTLDRAGPLRVVLSPPAAPITGRIIGADGSPVGLRTIVLANHLEREAEQHSTEVAEDGSFSLADLAHAHYRIRAIRDGHEIAVLGRAAPGEQVELRVPRSLAGRDLHVEVRDDADQPTPFVRVDGGPFRGAKTDADGRVEAREVLPGSYTLSVRVAGCLVVRTRVDVSEGLDTVHHLVRLPASCVISGPDE